MDFMDQLKGWWPLIILIINALAVWALWSFRRATISSEDFNNFTRDFTLTVNSEIKQLGETLQQSLNDHERRITSVEAHVQHSPTHEDIDKIHTRLSGISRSTSKVEGSVEAMSHQSTVIYQYLLDKQ